MFLNDLPRSKNYVINDLYAYDATFFNINSSKDVIKPIYKSYIQPQLEACNMFWENTSQRNLLKTYDLKKACRIIFNYYVLYMAESMKKPKMLTIYERIFRKKLKFIFKVFMQEASISICNQI